MNKSNGKVTDVSDPRFRAEKRLIKTQFATGPHPKNEDTLKLIHCGIGGGEIPGLVVLVAQQMGQEVTLPENHQ